MNIIKFSSETDDGLFLPNFCHLRMIFFVILLAELIAFVLTLIPLSQENHDWYYLSSHLFNDLTKNSLFIQWISLISIILLCIIRQWLRQFSNNLLAAVLSYLLILMVIIFSSELVWHLQELNNFVHLSFSKTHYPFLLKNLAIGLVAGGGILAYVYYLKIWKNSTLVTFYISLMMLILILSELASFFLVSTELRHQAAQHQLFLLRNVSVGAIITAIMLHYFYIQYHWKKETVAHVHARVQALQARIRPHFLFNSMNSIASLIRLDPEKAEEAIEDFAELFRASLADVREAVTLADEITLCEQYLRIETLRLEERLQIKWNVDNVPKDALLPRLSLQPLIENAIYHGIQPLPEGGLVEITGLFDGENIKIEVENPVPEKVSVPSLGNQIAQQNIHQRLQVYYGHNQAKLSVQKQSNTYRASLYFPYLQR